MKVVGASLDNGMLSVDVVREVPEAVLRTSPTNAAAGEAASPINLKRLAPRDANPAH